MASRERLKPKKFPSTEAGVWNWLNGKGHRCVARRRRIRDRTVKMFPKGMSVKVEFLNAVRQHIGNGRTFVPNTRGEHLTDVHSNAWRYLEMYGIEYKPFAWPGRPDMGEPRRKKCFQNAMVLAYIHNDVGKEKGRKPHAKVGRARGRHTLYNVQGIALGPLVTPMLHGWNAWGKGKAEAIDWTFYSANQWTRYIGIPLTYEETVEISRTKGRNVRLISIFDKNMFDLKVRLALTRVLHRRKRAGKMIPVRPTTQNKGTSNGRRRKYNHVGRDTH